MLQKIQLKILIILIKKDNLFVNTYSNGVIQSVYLKEKTPRNSQF